LRMYSIFRHIHKDSKKGECLHHACLSICLHLSAWLALDGFLSNFILGTVW
jgi:hypothetical protein